MPPTVLSFPPRVLTDAVSDDALPRLGQTRMLVRSAAGAPARYTDWRTRPAGQVPSAANGTDDGTPWVISKSAANTESAVVANNRLEVSWPNSASGAYYLQAPMASKVRRIGASFGFGPSANGTSGSFCLATWTTDGAQPGTSQAHCHLFTTASGWLFQVVSGGVIVTITQGGYAAVLPQDWTELRMEVVIEGSTAYIYLPDGSTAIANDSRIGSIAGYSPCWEFYRDGNTTTVPLAFYETWADTRPQPLASISAAGLARTLALYPTTQTVISALGSYTPTSEADLAQSTSSRRTLGNGAQQASPGNHVHTLGAHASSHASGGSDPITPASIGASASDHTHASGGSSGPHASTHGTNGSDPVSPASIGAVSTANRMPPGGVSSLSWTNSGMGSLSATGPSVFRIDLQANGGYYAPSSASSVDGQRMRFHLYGNGAARTWSFGNYETSPRVPSLNINVPSGKWVMVETEFRNDTWRLVDTDADSVALAYTTSGFTPADHGCKVWTCDPLMAGASSTPTTNGYLYATLLDVPEAFTCSGVMYYLSTALVTPTASRNYIGLWSLSSRSLLASSADQGTNWSTVGARSTAWSASVNLSPGYYYVGVITNASTRPQFGAVAGYSHAVGRTASNARAGSIGTAYTALPNPLPSFSNYLQISAYWFGLY